MEISNRGFLSFQQFGLAHDIKDSLRFQVKRITKRNKGKSKLKYTFYVVYYCIVFTVKYNLMNFMIK